LKLSTSYERSKAKRAGFYAENETKTIHSPSLQKHGTLQEKPHVHNALYFIYRIYIFKGNMINIISMFIL